MTQKDQLKVFCSRDKRSLEAEDLFYTSSKNRFTGSLKLWLAENNTAFFSENVDQESNYFVSKNRTVNSTNPLNSGQHAHQTLFMSSGKQTDSGSANVYLVV